VTISNATLRLILNTLYTAPLNINEYKIESYNSIQNGWHINVKHALTNEKIKFYVSLQIIDLIRKKL
jgi:hypothetical protein